MDFPFGMSVEVYYRGKKIPGSTWNSFRLPGRIIGALRSLEEDSSKRFRYEIIEERGLKKIYITPVAMKAARIEYILIYGQPARIINVRGGTITVEYLRDRSIRNVERIEKGLSFPNEGEGYWPKVGHQILIEGEIAEITKVKRGENWEDTRITARFFGDIETTTVRIIDPGVSFPDAAMTDKADRAVLANAPGGIDLASKHLNMESSGQKVNITFDPAMIAQFKRGDFSGVRIQILDVTPVSLMPLLGLK
jgi:hypothetical protein